MERIKECEVVIEMTRQAVDTKMNYDVDLLSAFMS